MSYSVQMKNYEVSMYFDDQGKVNFGIWDNYSGSSFSDVIDAESLSELRDNIDEVIGILNAQADLLRS